MKKLLAALLTLTLLMSVFVLAAADEKRDTEIASSVYGWVLSDGTKDDAGCVSVEIMQIPAFEKKTYVTPYPLDTLSKLTQTSRADAVLPLLKENNLVEILLNGAGEAVDFNRVEEAGDGWGDPIFTFYHDSAKYGGELTGKDGVPGRMVAQGWVLNKTEKTITVGDGNHVTNVFEQTYDIADDAKIFVVDNPTAVEGNAVAGTWAGTAGSLADVVVCPKGEDGEIYYQPEKYNVLCIFDGDYTTYGNGAKVNELYILKNPLVLEQSGLVTPDDTTYDGLGWDVAISAAKEKHGESYDGSCTPFEVMKNRLYSVGDSYTNIYLMIGDDGTMTLLDEGNRDAAYQYWLNIEKVGFDPRQVDNIVLTHGHGDHYQALIENCQMIDRYQVAQGAIKAGEQYVSVATSTENKDGLGYVGYPELGPVLTDNSIRYLLTDWDVWYQWRDDLGGGVQLYPFLTLGHSADTASFGFKFTATAEDAVFKQGDVVAFAYMGGYGAKNSLKSGYDRLAYVDSLRYIQSEIAPMLANESDYLYNLPQHSNQYPWYDVAKAARAAGVPFMSVLQEGLDAVQNFCEKRISYNTYDVYYDAWKAQTDEMGNMLMERGGLRCAISGKNLQTIESYGPYKRAAGEYELTVQSALVLHGFDAWQNPSEAFKGQTNVYGFDLSKGMLIHKDSFVHDPDTWFVQIVCKVNDDYAGKVDYDTNFYGKENYAEEWKSGPVEIVNRPDQNNWNEIVRTKRVSSKAEAEALLAAIQPGGTYKVNMDLISDILLGETPEQTFVKVN